VTPVDTVPGAGVVHPWLTIFKTRAVRRPRRLIRLGAIVSLWAVLGAATGLGLSVTVPAFIGYRVLTVLSGSMHPALSTGDVIINNAISPLDAKVGDIVTFRDPEDESRLVTHRVRRIRISGSTAFFETKGEVNKTVEKWTVGVGGTIGRVEYRIPRLGYVASRLGGRFARFGLIVVPALLLGAFELKRIWRPTRRQHDEFSA
jgi:signal peptidase I